MSQAQLQKMDETVLGWLDDVSDIVMKRVCQRMQIETKSGHRDLVTNVDRKLNSIMCNILEHLIRKHRF